jgi:hypothetical protein
MNTAHPRVCLCLVKWIGPGIKDLYRAPFQGYAAYERAGAWPDFDFALYAFVLR